MCWILSATFKWLLRCTKNTANINSSQAKGNVQDRKKENRTHAWKNTRNCYLECVFCIKNFLKLMNFQIVQFVVQTLLFESHMHNANSGIVAKTMQLSRYFSRSELHFFRSFFLYLSHRCCCCSEQIYDFKHARECIRAHVSVSRSYTANNVPLKYHLICTARLSAHLYNNMTIGESSVDWLWLFSCRCSAHSAGLHSVCVWVCMYILSLPSSCSSSW